MIGSLSMIQRDLHSRVRVMRSSIDTLCSFTKVENRKSSSSRHTTFVFLNE